MKISNILNHFNALLLFAITVLSGSVNATIIIDFESAATSPSGGIPNGNPYISNGFSLTAPTSNSINVFQDGWQNNRGSSNGTNVAAINSQSTQALSNSLFLASISGFKFSLLSIDFAELLNQGDFAESASAKSVEIIGYQDGINVINALFNLDGLSDGAGGNDDFQTLSFNNNWSALTSVEFKALNTTNPFGIVIAFDNITIDNIINDIPEPSSLVMLCLTMLGISAYRRNKLSNHSKLLA